MTRDESDFDKHVDDIHTPWPLSRPKQLKEKILDGISLTATL